MVYAVSEVRRMKFRIGELADKCGVNKETIRYYERLGLIPEPERTEKGYRMYSPTNGRSIAFHKTNAGIRIYLK